MADITIFKPADLVVNVVDGDPPQDQSALVAQLQAENAALKQAIENVKAAVANV